MFSFKRCISLFTEINNRKEGMTGAITQLLPNNCCMWDSFFLRQENNLSNTFLRQRKANPYKYS